MQSYHILHENENPNHLVFCRGTGHKPLNPASFVIADICMFEGLTNHLPFRLILVCDGEPILSFWVMVRQKKIYFNNVSLVCVKFSLQILSLGV